MGHIGRFILCDDAMLLRCQGDMCYAAKVAPQCMETQKGLGALQHTLYGVMQPKRGQLVLLHSVPHETTFFREAWNIMAFSCSIQKTKWKNSGTLLCAHFE